uniref:LysM domain-containing protein n=1 Tax=Leersia perrieri TaxID=77586 RepID=A0A0D9W8F0_9ORYZ
MAAAAATTTSLRRSELCAAAVSAADTVSWRCAVALVALVLLGALCADGGGGVEAVIRGPRLGGAAARPCEEVYVVGEGETLHTISDKCGDAFIVERNPHIHDPDDVFPGLVIALRPTKNT